MTMVHIVKCLGEVYVDIVSFKTGEEICTNVLIVQSMVCDDRAALVKTYNQT